MTETANKEFKVGQVWLSREGKKVTITGINQNILWPIQAVEEGCAFELLYRHDGTYSTEDKNSVRDLIVQLVEVPLQEKVTPENIRPELRSLSTYSVGQKWITREGKTAEIISTSSNYTNWPISYILENDSNKITLDCTIGGIFNHDGSDGPYDLMYLKDGVTLEEHKKEGEMSVISEDSFIPKEEPEVQQTIFKNQSMPISTKVKKESIVHCSIDLETLGINSKAPIVQVGMSFFTRKGIFLNTQLTVNFEDAIKYGEADGSTIAWWLKQPKVAQDTLFQDPRSAVEVCEIIQKLVAAQEPDFFWAHATFDFPILKSLFKKLDIEFNLDHRKMMDLRTLELASGDYQWTEREGIHHNALDDAVHQAKNIINMLNKINVG